MWRLAFTGMLGSALALAACGGDESGGRTHGDDGARGGSPGASSGGASSGGTGGLAASEGGPGGTASAGGVAIAGGSANAGGAENTPDSGSAGRTDAGGAGGAGPVLTTRKLDVLLVVDDSRSMADKQAVLRATIPDLIEQLLKPELRVADLHVGVITSSLGTPGATTCEGRDDRAHLVGTLPRGESAGVPGGFAAWREGEERAPVVASVQGLVAAASEFGCGFEAPLEAMYRFLVDPRPAAGFELHPCHEAGPATCLFPTGTDDVLLAQRRSFLRPDSAVAVIVLSDENDCSTRPTGQSHLAGNGQLLLPRATASCALDPNDPCCTSCSSPVPPGCAPDPTCETSPTSSSAEDELNLRCFEQKRRFGVDFLYPISRYVNALRGTTLCMSRDDLDARASCPDEDADGSPDVVPNPLFAPLASDGAAPRTSLAVYALGIVGVPWQTLRAQTDALGNQLPPESLVFPSGVDLALRGTWEKILGDPQAHPRVPPTDALMLESITPRTGTTPGTGEALAPADASYLANSVNGHEVEWRRSDDLQFACIFALPEPRDCVAIDALPVPHPGCDCSILTPYSFASPLCQSPGGTYDGSQRFAKAYPGLRQLEWLKGLGESAALGSICARNLTDESATDYGYRPAVEALTRELARTVR